MKTYEKILEYFAIALLVVVGVLGLFVTVLDFIGSDFAGGPWSWVKGPLPVILLIVAALALALGIERFVRFRDIARQFTQMERALTNHMGAQLVEDYDELYTLAMRMVRDAKRQIRASSFGPGRPDSPESYRKAVRDILEQSSKQSKPVRMDVVMGGDLDGAAKTLLEDVKIRRKQYADAGVAKLVQIHVTDISWGLDFLIIDDCHAMLAFPSLRGVKQLRMGLAFRNQPKIVKEFAIWFDEYLLRNATKYEDFLKQHQPSVTTQSKV